MNKALILVVEDDRPIRNLIVTTLKTHDYKYITAENGSSAILEASSHKPEIILLDLGLPDMEGVDVIKKVRTWSNIPIIVISARSEDVDKMKHWMQEQMIISQSHLIFWKSKQGLKQSYAGSVSVIKIRRMIK